MKKLSLFLFSMLALTMLTSCPGDDIINREVIPATFCSRTIEGNKVIFSQYNGQMEINFTELKIKFTTEFKDIEGNSHPLITNIMALNPTGNNLVYSFEGVSSNFEGIYDFIGYFDMSTGTTWYTFTYDGYTVVGTFNLLYAYTTTNVYNPDKDIKYDHNKSAYAFYFDSKGENCSMVIFNFTHNTTGTVDATELTYSGLKVTPTATGYTITAEMTESSYHGLYTIKDLNVTLDSHCRMVNGTFKSDDLEYRITGKLF